MTSEPMRFDSVLSFDGRIKRKAWWVIAAPIMAFNIILSLLSSSFPNDLYVQGLTIIIRIALLWPFWAVSAKRWHDRNKSGFWTLINLIPIVGSTWMVVECGCLKGIEGENEYGPAPE